MPAGNGLPGYKFTEVVRNKAAREAMQVRALRQPQAPAQCCVLAMCRHMCDHLGTHAGSSWSHDSFQVRQNN
jgi:hypothetical protein